MKRLINKLMKIAAHAAVLGVAMGPLLQSSALAQESSDLTISMGDHSAHVMPTPRRAAERAATSSFVVTSGAALLYHGGPVMLSPTTYAIFWVPATLQTGASTGMSAHYQNVQTAFLSLYPGHGIANNNTQYYMTQSTGFFYYTNYIRNAGAFGGSYVDTSPYPASACSDFYTPGNCISDAQVQAEIQKVMTLKGWTGGLNKMFLLFTSSGEGSCDGFMCAYTQYCAYHSYFWNGTAQVIYGNEPYADPAHCQVPGTPSPNGDAAADAAATVASHELTEAITDPLINAWQASNGEEIGDLCAWNYGPNNWDGGKANQQWFNYIGVYILGSGPIGFFELQEEYDNHAGGCVQLGP